MAGVGRDQGVEPGARGQALLVEGFAAGGDVGLPPSPMGQLCEVLLASRSFDTVRYLTPRAAERNRPSRLALHFHIEKLIVPASPLTLVALSGHLLAGADGIALDTSATLGRPYAHDSIPLRWLADALGNQERLLLFLEFDACGSDLTASDVVALFRGTACDQLIAAGPVGSSLVEAVVSGLRGGAATQQTGMVSFNSLGSFLARDPSVVVSGTGSNAEFLVPPSPLGLWGFGAADRDERIAARELAGRTLPGQFHLQSVLDSGGFGTVYAARQLTLERDVAVKVVEAATTASAQLFVNEVRAIGRLDHPNVVRIYQADVTADGFPFCAMELLSGRSLRHVIDEEGAVGESRAVDLVVQLLAALSAAHDAGVIHGDVKPDNLVLVGEGDSERLVLIDFGLASLQAADARSVGGSPAYMAPEQLKGRLDRRSDLYAAGLILHELLVGQLPRRRPTGLSIAESIEPRLQDVLSRSLAEEVDDRYPTAGAFAAALTGRAAGTDEAAERTSPFRALTGYSESDEGAFYGRTEETVNLVTQVLMHPALVLTAPSGVGKTSLLRAGVIPRLRRLGFTTTYHRCRPGAELPAASTEASDVVVYDQLETLFLAEAGERHVDHLLSGLGDSDDRTVILSVREDFLARLIERMTPWALPPIVRLPPLSAAGAREAVMRPLEDRRVQVDPTAVDTLLAELQRAAAELGPRMGWGTGDFIYPPHLQLVCSSLYEKVRREQRLEASHLEGIRFSDVISDHLRHLLDGELSEDAARVARSLLAGLVGPDDTRVDRSEDALIAALPDGVDPEQGVAVLEFLRGRGLLLPIRVDGARGWELAHDSLVPRVVAWLDSQDLDRRRTRELVRHHMSRSSADAPYLLPRTALREIDRHAGLLDELDKLSDSRGVTASRLVQKSRSALRRRTAAFVAVAVATTSVVAYLVAAWMLERRAQSEQQILSAANLGRFELSLEPFEWDITRDRPVAVDPSTLDVPHLTFHDRDRDDPDEPGEPLEASLSPVERRGASFVVRVEVRGGPAFVSISGRGRRGTSCRPSLIPLRWLPGYVDRPSRPKLRLVYPTCAASVAGTVVIPAGEFIRAGVGTPPSSIPELRPRTVVDLPEYRIQRTEVTNAAYAHYASMADATGRAMPSYPTADLLADSGTPDRPVANIDFSEARDYCRFLGLGLPTGDQWEKAARGGLYLDRGGRTRNPHPERSHPWGPELWTKERANLDPDTDGYPGSAPVGSFPAGASPYGLVDMAGNVHEWVTDRATQGGRHRGLRGGGLDVVPADQYHHLQYVNARDERYRDYAIGLRCAGAP
jgi:serine/threonine protein kinase/formylglycine-generating enzyme required for sulfatase activity